MRVLFTICGRAGSKGVKNKNLKDFCGAPLVYYTLAAIHGYKQYLSADDVLDVALNTDSEQLVELVCKQKALPVFVVHRTEDLAGDAVPKVAVIQDTLQHCEAHFGCQYDVVVDLDITSPLRGVEDVKAAIDKKLQRPDTHAVYSVVPSRRNPYFNMVMERDGFSGVVMPSTYTARQQAPAIYDMNASIYAYSPQSLKTRSCIGFFAERCSFTVMKDTGILDIDSEEDYELMQILADYLFKKHADLKEVAEAAKQLAK